jgi:predicted dehydrogenase
MNKKIEVSISGLGVGERHTKHVIDNRDASLHSVFDTDKKKLRKVKKKFKINSSKSFMEMISNNKIKLVVIASPDHIHCEQIIESFKNKKHIFTEKPICNNLRELKQIVFQWKKNKKKLMFRSNLILRSSPLFLWLKKKILEGYFGKIYSIDAEYLYGRLNKFIDGWRGNSKDYSPMNGGGVHMIDLACWLVNELPYEVSSYSSNTATKKFKLKSKDYISSTLKFKSGVILRAVANLACVYKHQHILKVYGTKKTFVYDDLGPRIYNTRNPKKNFKKILLKSLPSNKVNILKEFINDIKINKNIIKQTEFDLRIMNVLCYCNISTNTSKKEIIKYII